MDTLRFRLRVFMFLFFVIMLLGTLGFSLVEGLSPVDAFYFSLVTVTTVGYGDIHPATQIGKILAVILIICGVGTFLGVVAAATEMLLNRRETRVRMQKLHMVTGLFFGEVGTRLLADFSQLDPQLDLVRGDLTVTAGWSEAEFSRVGKRLGSYAYDVDIRPGELEKIRGLLEGKSTFLLRLLENPVLLEHEHLTELLRAVFHLREELLYRDGLTDLPETDYAHLAGDIKRAYILLLREWVDYMKYLKGHYPYLFSLAMRTNPFNPETSAVVR
jgi:voltage-gated potassium channel